MVIAVCMFTMGLPQMTAYATGTLEQLQNAQQQMQQMQQEKEEIDEEPIEVLGKAIGGDGSDIYDYTSQPHDTQTRTFFA